MFLAVGAGLVVVGFLGALAPAAMFGVLIGLLPVTAAAADPRRGGGGHACSAPCRSPRWRPAGSWT